MLAVAATIGLIVAGLAMPAVWLARVTLDEMADGTAGLPVVLDVEPLAQRSTVLDRNGQVVARLFDRNRVVVGLDEVDPVLVKAVLAIEDSRFYEHGGVDFRGTARALLNNIMSGGVVQGGSSITQQLVKMTLVEQATSRAEREDATASTYSRKVREVRFAVYLEQTHSKDWILERYLNTAYFGASAYGVEAAAERYFSRSASDLNLRQAALIAGLAKYPTRHDPLDTPAQAWTRRNVVVDRMAELGLITSQRAERIKARGLGLEVMPVPNGCVRSAAPFFCEYVRASLLRDPSLGRTEAEREDLLRTGGLTIHTTLDLRFQRAADGAARSRVFPTDDAIGALAMLEPGTGDVLAVAQSRPMGRDAQAGETFLNYAVPKKYGDANGFHAGSTFKAFVLAAAIRQGIPPTTRIHAPPQVEIPVRRFRTCGGYPLSDEVWSPENSTGSGVYNLYTGTQESVNTFYAKLELRTGLCEPYRLARRMGIPLTDPSSQQVPSFTLGVVDVSPLTMAEAYATFAARGRHCTARPITRVTDADDNRLRRYPARCRQVLPPAVADVVNDVLRGVQEPGGFGHGAGLSLEQPSAGKTGTSQRNRSVWFIGYTPDLVAAAVLAGVDDAGRWKTLNRQVIGGEHVPAAFGSTHAGPIWGEAMKAVQRRLPDTDFVQPERRDTRRSR